MPVMRPYTPHAAHANKPATFRAGFTLLELLVAISILAVIVAIVYEGLFSVTDSTERARFLAERTRLQRYLRRNLTQAFESVYSDPACMQADYSFQGINEDDSNGPMDAVEFCSTAPMGSGMSLPGMLKRVRIELMDSDESDQTLSSLEIDAPKDENEYEGPELRVTEKPLVLTQLEGMDSDTNSTAAQSAINQITQSIESDFSSSSWAVPIKSFDVQYFDGEDWVEEWDSTAIGRMPWCVMIRINFAEDPAANEDGQAEFTPRDKDTADFQLMLPIPVGVGVYSEFVPAVVAGDQIPVDRDGDGKPDNDNGVNRPGGSNNNSNNSSNNNNNSNNNSNSGGNNSNDSQKHAGETVP